MEHPFLTLFKPLLATRTTDEAVAYLLKHPVLTSPYYTELLEKWAGTQPPPERSAIERMIQLKLATFQDIRGGRLRIELPNPITDLATKVTEGKFTLQHAQQIAGRPEVFVELMYPAVTSVCDAAEKIVVREWRLAVTIMKILFSALDARRELIVENQQAMELTSIETWLAVACRACADVPDGRIFHDAVKRGDAVADVVTNSDPPAPILHRLGVLHLDPYVAGRNDADLDQQLRRWQERLPEEYGAQLAGIPPAELYMPDIDEALPRAEQYFRRAAARRSGEARGRTLKALVQTLRWQQIRNLPVNAEDCTKLAREALTLLPQASFPAEHAEIRQIIARLDESRLNTASEAAKAARAILETPVDTWVQQKGVVPTIDIYHMNAQAVTATDPGLALQLWMAVDQLIRSRPESVRSTHDGTLVRLLVSAVARDAPRADGSPIQAKLQSFFQSAQQGKWPVAKVAYALLSFAASTTAKNQEGEGLKLLDDYAQIFDAAGHDAVVARCLPFLRAVLQTGHAVNAYDADRFGDAAEAYADAVAGDLEAGQPLAALDILRRLLDLSAPGKPEEATALNALVAGLSTNALTLELEAGEAATNLIQSACRSAMSWLMASGSAKTTVLLFVLDAAKGRRFRASLAGPGAALDWLNLPRTLSIEQDLLRLRNQAALEIPGKPSVIDENMFLTSYVSASEKQGGATATEQLRNLQIQFDNGLDHQLSSGEEDGWVPTIEKIQSLLDETDVLLIQYIGKNAQGALAITTLLISSSDSVGGQAISPEVPADGVIVLGDKDMSTTSNWLSLPVANLRDLVVSPPGPRAADSRALEILEHDYNRYLGGPLGGALEKFHAAGRNHLCVAPHGPLHFYPFHLLGPEDQPLANDWCVTYLPHIRLLDRAEAAAANKIELTSIGVNFVIGNRFGLTELTNSEDEARAVATAYGPEASLLPGRLATKRAVLDAITGSNRVHIATHGRHNVNAPSFQCIFLDAGPPDDRIIYAYELLRLDLHGLDLVTLSACETALGRIDVADNLRGIPAALLIAGVSTIVGTLWNVEAVAAARFFTTFYRVLKEKGGTKKTAFYEAQSDTRREFPKYRDWAAFQLIGSWS